MGAKLCKSVDKKYVVDDSLEKYDNKCPMFTLEGEEHQAKVVNIYDGDTIKVVFKIFDTYYRWNCRVMGVDTPEMKTHNEKEKIYATKARDALREKIMDKIITVKCGKFDKYGRLLIDIYYEKIHINQWLIDEKYAFAYDGKTKKDWGEYLKNI